MHTPVSAYGMTHFNLVVRGMSILELKRLLLSRGFTDWGVGIPYKGVDQVWLYAASPAGMQLHVRLRQRVNWVDVSTHWEPGWMNPLHGRWADYNVGAGMLREILEGAAVVEDTFARGG